MIGVVAAMDTEINDLISIIVEKEEKQIGKYTFYNGKIDGVKVVILKCGIGKVSAAVGVSLMIELYKPKYIINTGIAGGVSGVSSKDIILTKTLTYGDVDCTIFGYDFGQVPQMPCKYQVDEVLLNKVTNALNEKKLAYKLGHAITFDSFITSLKGKAIKKEDITICEMEGAAIAQTCHILNTPFLGIRYISDIVDSESQISDYQTFETEMAHLSSAIIKNIIALI